MVKDWGAGTAGSRREAVMARRVRREPAISNQGEARTGWTPREPPYGDYSAGPENKGGAKHSAKWPASISLTMSKVSHSVCQNGQKFGGFFCFS